MSVFERLSRQGTVSSIQKQRHRKAAQALVHRNHHHAEEKISISRHSSSEPVLVVMEAMVWIVRATFSREVRLLIQAGHTKRINRIPH